MGRGREGQWDRERERQRDRETEGQRNIGKLGGRVG